MEYKKPSYEGTKKIVSESYNFSLNFGKNIFIPAIFLVCKLQLLKINTLRVACKVIYRRPGSILRVGNPGSVPSQSFINYWQ